MADTHVVERRVVVTRTVGAEGVARRPSFRAYQCLKAGFIVLPILAGVDKFTRVMADWDMYLASSVERLLPVSGDAFMMGAGVVEILAGVLVAVRPAVGAWVVAAWLGAIVVNLLLPPGYYDIALRDVGLIFGASALGLLAKDFDRR